MSKVEPIFKIGDLVRPNTSGQVTWSGFEAGIVIEVRLGNASSLAAFPVYTILTADGVGFDRYEFELEPVESEDAPIPEPIE